MHATSFYSIIVYTFSALIFQHLDIQSQICRCRCTCRNSIPLTQHGRIVECSHMAWQEELHNYCRLINAKIQIGWTTSYFVPFMSVCVCLLIFWRQNARPKLGLWKSLIWSLESRFCSIPTPALGDCVFCVRIWLLSNVHDTLDNTKLK